MMVLRCMLMGVLVWVTGCAKKNPAEGRTSSKMPHIQVDLKQMQGQWESRKDSGACTAQVEGNTIRLTYENPDSKTQFKRNACIKRVDAVNHQLQVHGDKKPWRYLLERNNSQVYLELRFYDESRHKWVQCSLEQPLEPALVAGI